MLDASHDRADLADGSRMSTPTTSLAEHPAGTVRFRSPRWRNRPARQKRWQNGLWDSTPPSVLLDEAERLVDAGSRRRAIQLLAVAAATADDGAQRHTVLRRLAVASAEGGQHRISCEAVFELQAEENRDADTWVTFANVALARGNYSHADKAARTALALDPDHVGAWTALAAGYAGLGWFDTADDCLNNVDRDGLSEQDRQRLGRAVNQWSLRSSRWLPAGLISALVVGLLAIAIAVSMPFLAREWRLQRLRATAEGSAARAFADMATDVWRFERRLRLGHALTVIASVAGFVATTVLL